MYIFLYMALAVLVMFAAVFLFLFYTRQKWASKPLSAARTMKSRLFVRHALGDKELQNKVREAGYVYDPGQNIFYSVMYPWQRRHGYSRLYDEGCAPLGMILDCEPVYFYYGGKNWLIEFWKGQYDLPTGSEVGIYTLKGPKLANPASAHYECASNPDRLYMAFDLKKNGKTLFTRQGTHWWLTGFRLGEFSEPSELEMKIYIAFKNRKMCDAFLQGLENTGYKDDEFLRAGNTVAVRFGKPHSRQPLSRTSMTDRIIQRKNYFLCQKFIEATSEYGDGSAKIGALSKKSPELIEHILNMGKPRALFNHKPGSEIG